MATPESLCLFEHLGTDCDQVGVGPRGWLAEELGNLEGQMEKL